MRWYRTLLSHLRTERGQALVLSALMILVMLALAGLAIDIGMVMSARNESQRTSDASALAGASSFMDYKSTDPTSIDQAIQRAKEYAAQNYIRGSVIDTATAPPYIVTDSAGPIHITEGENLTVAVRPLEQRVTVWTRRVDLPMWFAKFAGVQFLGVKTMATAEVTEGGTSNSCLLPFTIVDLWDDLDDDLNANRLPDSDEQWLFEDNRELSSDQEPDRYYTYEQDGVSGAPYSGDFNGTGYGSNFRNGQVNGSGYTHSGDYGRQIILKAQEGEGGSATGGSDGGGWEPEDSGEIGPGNFQMWNMPDPEAGCEQGRTDNPFLWSNIDGCNTCPISLGVDYPVRTGDIESIKHPLRRLYEEDPNATWVYDANHPKGGYIANSQYSNPEENSPLVRTVAIMPPTVNVKGDDKMLHFVQFAKVFIQPSDPEGAVYSHFLGPVTGGEGSTTGSLVKQLRLIK